MFESLNEFFTATYAYNHTYLGIQLLAVMSLAGIGLGLMEQLLFKGYGKLRGRQRCKKTLRRNAG